MSLEREQLLGHGTAQLARDGLEFDLTKLSIETAATACGVDADTARGLFQGQGTAPDVSYGRAVVSALIRQQLSDVVERSVVSEMIEVISRSIDDTALDGTIPSERRRGLIQELCKSGAAAALDLPKSSPSWRASVVISSLVFAHPETNRWLVDVWDGHRHDTAPRLENLYAPVASVFGMRLRACYSWEQFLAAISAVGEGLIMRAESLGEAATVERPTGPDGAIEQWPLLAVAGEAMLQQFFEPIDPADASPFAHEPSPGAGRG